LTSDDRHNRHQMFLARLRESGEDVSLAEKRQHLKTIADEFKRSRSAVLPQIVMPIVQILSEDGSWEVRQDVAELLVYVPEGDFSRLTGRLVSDFNGYVRRSAEKSRERRRQAEIEAKRASRGIEQVSLQYQNLTKQVGGEVADEAIQLAEKRFTLLADALVHDLLSVLAGAKTQVRRLVKRLADGDADILQMAVKLSEDMDFMEQYFRSVEAYSRALSPERHLEWMQEVVHQAVEQARRGLEAYGVDLGAISVDESHVSEVRAEVSRELIVQAISNIVTNAYEAFLDQEGRIREGRIDVSSRTDEGCVIIDVRDNGCGLSDKELSALRAFLPGRKNHNKKRSKGLGLLTAKKNIEAHDGTLTVESTLGEGTTVTIMLPLTAGEMEDE